MATEDTDSPEDADRRTGNGDRERIDELREWLDARYRRVTYLLMSMGVIVIVVTLVGGLALRARQIEAASQRASLAAQAVSLRKQQKDIQDGRHVALSVICAATTATIEAGRASITGGAEPGPPAFTKALERLGFPPLRRRKAAAQDAAAAYANLISSRISTETGVANLVRPNGSLNCDRLLNLARTP